MPNDPGLPPNRWNSGSDEWDGKFIVSGQVVVEYTVLGQPFQTVTRLAVRPRGGVWSASTPWKGKIGFVQGEGPDCGGKRPAGRVVGMVGWVGWVSSLENSKCEPEIQYRVQIDPFGEAGYRVTRQNEGPNANYWYVDDAWWYFKATSQLNRGVFPNSTQYTLWTESQSDSCESKGKGRTTNFWEFNRYCRPQRDFGRFIVAAWNHEYQHFVNGKNELLKDHNNLYFKVEGLVRSTLEGVIDPLTDFHRNAQNRMRDATGAENVSGNWSGSVWIWHNQVDNHLLKTTTSF